MPTDDPNLVYTGKWIGNTSQVKLLQIDVEEVSSKAWIVEARIAYLENGKYLQRFISNQKGIAQIEEKEFRFNLPDGWMVQGFFDEKDMCFGYLSRPSGKKPDDEKFTFQVKRESTAIDIHSIPQVMFDLDGVTHFYEQQFEQQFPFSGIIASDSGFTLVSGFNVGGDNVNGQSILTIRYANLEALEEIQNVFVPEKIQYAQSGKAGIEIILNDPGFYFQTWSTIAETANQSDSSFEIVDILEIETGNQKKLYKFIAVFDCTVYRKWSRVIKIENGIMIGYFAFYD